MKYGSVNEYAVSTPSMSDTFSPESSSARLAAWAFRPRPVMCGTLPMSDSPTPTMATLFFRDARAVFMVCPSRRDALNWGIMAPSPRSSKVTFTAVADLHVAARRRPTTLAIMRGPSSRSISATT